MKIVKTSKNTKLIPWLDMKIVKKIQKNKINSLTWYDFIEFDCFGGPIIYQNIDNLNKACPNHLGDWYFTGNYPTPGGVRVVNKAFVYHMEGNPKRAY